MSSPDFRKDLGAFIKMVYGDDLKTAFHHTRILDTIGRRHTSKDYWEENVKFTGAAMDPGKHGGDHTAYVRYTYDGHTIHIDDMWTEEVQEPDYDDRARRGRPSIAELLERVGKKRCKCDGGLNKMGKFETGGIFWQVCTKCDGFNSRRLQEFP